MSTDRPEIFKQEWFEDKANPKIMLNFPRLFTSHIDGESNMVFGEPKIKKMRTYMERGYHPNTIMPDIAKAHDDYLILKKMFNLE
jgi:hypothetical protein